MTLYSIIPKLLTKIINEIRNTIISWTLSQELTRFWRWYSLQITQLNKTQRKIMSPISASYFINFIKCIQVSKAEEGNIKAMKGIRKGNHAQKKSEMTFPVARRIKQEHRIYPSLFISQLEKSFRNISRLEMGEISSNGKIVSNLQFVYGFLSLNGEFIKSPVKLRLEQSLKNPRRQASSLDLEKTNVVAKQEGQTYRDTLRGVGTAELTFVTEYVYLGQPVFLHERSPGELQSSITPEWKTFWSL